MITEEKPALAHYGVKGMKWGVRKGYAERKRASAAQSIRVGQGKGSLIDKAYVHGFKTPLVQVVSSGGFKKAALVTGQRERAHANRVEKGSKKVYDLMRLYSDVRLSDIRVERKKK